MKASATALVTEPPDTDPTTSPLTIRADIWQALVAEGPSIFLDPLVFIPRGASAYRGVFAVLLPRDIDGVWNPITFRVLRIRFFEVLSGWKRVLTPTTPPCCVNPTHSVDAVALKSTPLAVTRTMYDTTL